MANNKDITLAEFRAWLEGVEELQPTKWSPNPVQWKLIRKKMDLIVETQQVMAQQPLQRVREAPAQRHSQLPVDSASLPAPEEIPKIPTDLSRVPRHEQSALGGIKTTEGRIVTPNIDTSTNNFRSSFE